MKGWYLLVLLGIRGNLEGKQNVIRCVEAAAAAASSWGAVIGGIIPLTADRFTAAGMVGAIVNDIGTVPAAEGMYANETFGNGTERPDGRVRFGTGSDAGISAA